MLDPSSSSALGCQPVSFESVTQPGNDATLVATADPNSLWLHQPPRCHISNQSGDPFMFAVTSCSPLLELKKDKIVKGGAPLDSVRVCTLCNVVCNSLDAFNKHITGRKHAAVVSLASLGETGLCFAAVRAQFESHYKKPTKKVKIVQFAWCQVCQINCNSKEAYAIHLYGKKHLTNVDQLKNSTNNTKAGAVPSSASAGLEENPEAKHMITKPSKKASREEMEAKRQKVVEAGAATGAIRTCSTCNVVCNSRTVYESHLGGQKHKDMLNKLLGSS